MALYAYITQCDADTFFEEETCGVERKHLLITSSFTTNQQPYLLSALHFQE